MIYSRSDNPPTSERSRGIICTYVGNGKMDKFYIIKKVS